MKLGSCCFIRPAADEGALVLDVILLQHAASAVPGATGHMLLEPLDTPTLLSARLACRKACATVEQDQVSNTPENRRLSGTHVLSACGAARVAMAALARPWASSTSSATTVSTTQSPPSALDIAAASAPLDACRTLLRAVVRDAGAMGHSLDFVLRDALAAAVGADRPAVAAMLVDAIVAHAPNHVDHNSARVRLGFAGEYSNIPFQVYGLLLSPASDLDKAARLSGWLAVTVFCAGAAYAVAAMCLHTRRLPRQGLSQTYWTELQLTKALVQGKAYVARAVMARGISESALGTPVALWRGEAWLLRARLPETAFFTIVYIANAYSFLPSSTEPNQSRLWLACVWVFVGGLSLYPLLVCWCLLRYACKRVQKWWPLAALGKGKRGKHVKPE